MNELDDTLKQTILDGRLKLNENASSQIIKVISRNLHALHRKPASQRCLLVVGRTGTGKSLLCESLKEASRRTKLFNIVSLDSIQNVHNGDYERSMCSKFEEAIKRQPCIMLLDDIDNIMRTTAITSLLCRLLDKLSSVHRICVLATLGSRGGGSNRATHVVDLDARLQRADRFSSNNTVFLTMPNAVQRRMIVSHYINQLNLDDSMSREELCDFVVGNTIGFSGADIVQFVQESVAHSTLQNTTPNTPKIALSSFEHALAICKPSAVRAFGSFDGAIVESSYKSDKSSIGFNRVCGMSVICERLSMLLEPLKRPSAYERIGIRAPRGILLYGQSGCGKSLLLRALGEESGTPCIFVAAPSLLSKVVGESERLVKEMFSLARAFAPSVLVLDQVDVIARRRGFDASTEQSADRLLSCLLEEMDGFLSADKNTPQVLLVAATNRRDLLDEAVLRPGRFDESIHVPMPRVDTRCALLRAHLKGRCTTELSEKIDDIASTKLQSTSCAQILALCRTAAMNCLRRSMSLASPSETDICITLADFENALHVQHEEQLSSKQRNY